MDVWLKETYTLFRGAGVANDTVRAFGDPDPNNPDGPSMSELLLISSIQAIMDYSHRSQNLW